MVQQALLELLVPRVLLVLQDFVALRVHQERPVCKVLKVSEAVVEEEELLEKMVKREPKEHR